MTGPHVPSLAARLRPALGPAVTFAAIAAATLLAAIGTSLHIRGFAPLPRTGVALLVLAVPPALAGGVLSCVIDVLLPRAGRTRRGIGMLAGLATIGLAASIAVFALVYRDAYPEEFAPLLSMAGLHEAVWTVISATYLFLVFAPALYLPLGPVAVLALATLYALRRPSLRPLPYSVRDRSSVHDIEKSR